MHVFIFSVYIQLFAKVLRWLTNVMTGKNIENLGHTVVNSAREKEIAYIAQSSY